MKARLSREHYKQVVATGKAPIYLRLTWGPGPGPGKSTDIATGVFCTAKEWDQRGQRLKGDSEQARTDRARLAMWLARADQEYLRLKDTPGFSLEVLRAAVKGQAAGAPTLLALADQFFAYKSRPEQRKSFNTLASYRVRRRKLEFYLRHLRALDLRADVVDLPWLRVFERWCLDRAGHNATTARKHVRHVQEVIDFGAHEGLLPANPIAKYKSQAVATPKDPLYLPESDVQRLACATLSTRGLQDVADAWLFCCYTGMSFVEYARFTPAEHLHADATGRQWIRIARQKNMWRTTAKVSIPVLPELVKLLAACRGQVPKISNQYFNRALKLLTAELGLSVPLTVGLARHTASHRFRNVYGFTDEAASAFLGHTQKIMNSAYSRKREEGLSLELDRLFPPAAPDAPAAPTLRQQLEAALAAAPTPETRAAIQAAIDGLPPLHRAA